MTTETVPDPVIEAWSDNLEEDLVAAGMEQPQAHAYRQAFELGMTRVLSVVATKQELRDGLADIADQLRREMNIHVAHFEKRFSEFKRIVYGVGGLLLAGLITLIVRAFS